MLSLNGEALLELPLPERKPFREAKLRIVRPAVTDRTDRKLVGLLAEAMEVRELVQASPDLSPKQPLEADLPIYWSAQEWMLGFAA